MHGNAGKLKPVLKKPDETKQLAIQMACKEHNYKWPKDLFTGVMFYQGHKITIDEFNDWANKFK